MLLKNLCVLIASVVTGAASAQTLVGDTIGYETVGVNIENISGTAVVGPGPEFTFTGLGEGLVNGVFVSDPTGMTFAVDIDATSITITASASEPGFSATLGYIFGFLGSIRITDINFEEPTFIVGYSVSGTGFGITRGDVTLIADTIEIGSDTSQNETFALRDGQTFRVDITTETPECPIVKVGNTGPFFEIGFDGFEASDVTPFVCGVENGFRILVSRGGAPAFIRPAHEEAPRSGRVLATGFDFAGGPTVITISREDGRDFEYAGGFRDIKEGVLGRFEAAFLEGFNDGQSVGTDVMDFDFRYATNLLGKPIDTLVVTIPNNANQSIGIDRLTLMPVTDPQSLPAANFAALNTGDVSLWDIDFAARSAARRTLTSAPSDGVGRAESGLASLNGAFYTTHPFFSGESDLTRVSGTTGVGGVLTADADPGLPDVIDALAADRRTGTLYAIGSNNDTLYAVRVLDGERTFTSLAVLSQGVGEPFGRATGAAFDPVAGVLYFITDDMPSETLHLWSVPISGAGQTEFAATRIGDTGIASWEKIVGVGPFFFSDVQTGLAFDPVSQTLAMTSREGPTTLIRDRFTRFFTLDTQTAAPTFVFTTTTPGEEFDNLAPTDLGYTVLATSGQAIPASLTANQQTGEIYAAMDTEDLTRVTGNAFTTIGRFGGDIQSSEITGIEFATAEQTGTADDAVYTVNERGQIEILPLEGERIVIPLSNFGITVGTEIGIARRGQDLYFTSGDGTTGSLYRFDPRDQSATQFSTQLAPNPGSLEYVPQTDLFYYIANDPLITLDPLAKVLHTYNPATDTSTSTGLVFELIPFPTLAVDPDGRTLYTYRLDTVVGFPIPIGATPGRTDFRLVDSLPVEPGTSISLVFARSTKGTGSSLYLTTNGLQFPDPTQILEFPGFTAFPCSNADLSRPFGVLEGEDLRALLALLEQADAGAEYDGVAGVDAFDLVVFLGLLVSGCP